MSTIMTCKVRWEVTQGEKREERWEEMRRVEKWGGRENRLGNDWGERRGREVKREVRRGEVRRNQEKRGGMRRDKKWGDVSIWEERWELEREEEKDAGGKETFFSYIFTCAHIYCIHIMCKKFMTTFSTTLRNQHHIFPEVGKKITQEPQKLGINK